MTWRGMQHGVSRARRGCKDGAAPGWVPGRRAPGHGRADDEVIDGAAVVGERHVPGSEVPLGHLPASDRRFATAEAPTKLTQLYPSTER